jgi:hypothetical protein
MVVTRERSEQLSRGPWPLARLPMNLPLKTLFLYHTTQLRRPRHNTASLFAPWAFDDANLFEEHFRSARATGKVKRRVWRSRGEVQVETGLGQLGKSTTSICDPFVLLSCRAVQLLFGGLQEMV